MKNHSINKWTLLIVCCVSLLSIFSCEYTDIANAPYPGQSIYMPAAASGIFLLNDTNHTAGVFRYKLDIANRKLIVPLSVYRSGVNNDGTINITVIVNNDTINQLIAVGELVDEEGRNLNLLPSDAYQLPTAVVIADGKEFVSMNLELNLDYIATQPNKRLALAIDVFSPQAQTSTKVGTAIIELNTNFVVPTPQFTTAVDPKDDKKIIFYNKSSFATSCKWDFGDGEILLSDQDTIEHQFNNYKTFDVKLTVAGITNIPVTLTQPLRLWENITKTYIKNHGAPFSRSDPRTSLYGNLADWTTTDNLKTNGYGGFLKTYTPAGGTLAVGVMDFYTSVVMTNGKIEQTIFNLPKGSYRISFTTVDFIGTMDCDFVVIKGSGLPNKADLTTNPKILATLSFNKRPNILSDLFFTTTEAQDITIGFITNTNKKAKAELIIGSIGLYR